MRKSGILLHISSLPSRYGIGSLGKAAYRFADYLEASGMKLWQVLPLCPTSYGDSPYQSPSAFAGNPYFIDLELLKEDGLLTAEDLKQAETAGEYIDYGRLSETRIPILRKAFEAFAAAPASDYETFKQTEADWLCDYALFMTLKEKHGMISFEFWESELKTRDAKTLSYLKKNFANDVEFYRFLQYEFFTQWRKLKEYVNAKGIEIIGDMPIYVAYDSADLWANPELFLLEPDGTPSLVAGVPPDSFSEGGQLWGNPIYDWTRMEEDGYKWWIKRLKSAAKLYDIVRIDHFRGFESYYTVKYGAPDAKIGEWKKGPGLKLFKAIEGKANVKIIAEDLGYLDEDVRRMVRDTGFPSMKVLQFAFDGDKENEYLPDNYTENCIAYTGTHDNDTALGWYRAQSLKTKMRVRRILGKPFGCVVDGMIKKLMESRADYVVIPLQDVLEQDSCARMNVPSTVTGNWRYRIAEIPKPDEKFKKLVKSTGRA